MNAINAFSPLFRWTMTVLGFVTLFVLAAAADAQEPRSATISFERPSKYTDGSDIGASVAITDRVYQGQKGGAKTAVATIGGSPATINAGLQPGETCWHVTAIANGIESAPSNEACKSFPFPSPQTVIITVT